MSDGVAMTHPPSSNDAFRRRQQRFSRYKTHYFSEYSCSKTRQTWNSSSDPLATTFHTDLWRFYPSEACKQSGIHSPVCQPIDTWQLTNRHANIQSGKIFIYLTFKMVSLSAIAFAICPWDGLLCYGSALAIDLGKSTWRTSSNWFGQARTTKYWFCNLPVFSIIQSIIASSLRNQLASFGTGLITIHISFFNKINKLRPWFSQVDSLDCEIHQLDWCHLSCVNLISVAEPKTRLRVLMVAFYRPVKLTNSFK